MSQHPRQQLTKTEGGLAPINTAINQMQNQHLGSVGTNNLPQSAGPQPAQMPSYTVNGKTVEVIRLARLADPYPPVGKSTNRAKTKGFFMAEDEETHNRWEQNLKDAKQSDPRVLNDKRQPVVRLDFSKLQYDVQEGESIAFYDEDTSELVALVVQDMFGNEEIVQALNGSVIELLNAVQKPMRVSDLLLTCGVGCSEIG